MLRYKTMSHKFLNLAYQAASFLECCLLVGNALDCLGKQIEKKSVHLQVFCVIHILSNLKFNKMEICSVLTLKEKRGSTKKFKTTRNLTR
jgi:hypothetical protein